MQDPQRPPKTPVSLSPPARPGSSPELPGACRRVLHARHTCSVPRGRVVELPGPVGRRAGLHRSTRPMTCIVCGTRNRGSRPATMASPSPVLAFISRARLTLSESPDSECVLETQGHQKNSPNPSARQPAQPQAPDHCIHAPSRMVTQRPPVGLHSVMVQLERSLRFSRNPCLFLPFAAMGAEEMGAEEALARPVGAGPRGALTLLCDGAESAQPVRREIEHDHAITRWRWARNTLCFVALCLRCLRRGRWAWEPRELTEPTSC